MSLENEDKVILRKKEKIICFQQTWVERIDKLSHLEWRQTILDRNVWLWEEIKHIRQGKYVDKYKETKKKSIHICSNMHTYILKSLKKVFTEVKRK